VGVSETAATLYKVVGPHGEARNIPSGVPAFRWSLPTRRARGRWTPGEWHAVAPPILTCSRGLHVTTDPLMWLGDDVAARIFVAEVDGQRGEEREDKIAVERARLVREVALIELFPGVRILRGSVGASRGSGDGYGYGYGNGYGNGSGNGSGDGYGYGYGYGYGNGSGNGSRDGYGYGYGNGYGNGSGSGYWDVDGSGSGYWDVDDIVLQETTG